MPLAERMSRLGTESAFGVLARVEAMRSAGHDIVNLGIGAPDARTPSNIVDAAKRALDDGWHAYTPAKGLLELRTAVVDDISNRYGVEPDPENVMIVPGGKPTMFFALLMLASRGTEVLYPDPGFPIYRSMIEFAGATAVPIPLRESAGFDFDPDDLLSLVNERTRLIILNSPANPTGGVIGRDNLAAIVDGLKAFPDVFVLSDEIYSQIVYGDAQHVSMVEFESIRDRLIILNGWSKTYAMTGWRLGWGLWPSSLIEAAERLQINSNSCAPAAVQIAGIEALNGPQSAVDAMISTFADRREYLFDALTAIPGISLTEPDGAFYMFPNITETGMTSDEFETRLLADAGVAVLSGTSFGERGEGHVRLSYASDMDSLRTAVQRISGFLRSR